jgi:hypothetical protein
MTDLRDSTNKSSDSTDAQEARLGFGHRCQQLSGFESTRAVEFRSRSNRTLPLARKVSEGACNCDVAWKQAFYISRLPLLLHVDSFSPTGGC